MLRHRADALLILLALLQLTLMGFAMNGVGRCPWWALVASALTLIFLICTNYQVVAHNFIHQKFFKSPALNALFAAINGLNLGVPSFLYHAHHVNHHQHNNGPDDRSSTLRYGRGQKPESLLAYAFLSPLRTPLGTLFLESSSTHTRVRQIFELSFFLVAVAAIGFWSGAGLTFYLVVSYLGQVLAAAENYWEHWEAVPGDRFKNAVSCYSGWYNRLWFNNGYHQEHHYRPSLHWTRVPEVRGELPPETERPVVQGAHWFYWRRL